MTVCRGPKCRRTDAVAAPLEALLAQHRMALSRTRPVGASGRRGKGGCLWSIATSIPTRPSRAQHIHFCDAVSGHLRIVQVPHTWGPCSTALILVVQKMQVFHPLHCCSCYSIIGLLTWCFIGWSFMPMLKRCTFYKASRCGLPAFPSLC